MHKLSAQEYLDNEDFLDRDSHSLYKNLAEKHPTDLTKNLWTVLKKWGAGQISPKEFYSFICEPIGHSTLYDCLKARQRKGIEWLLNQYIDLLNPIENKSILDVCSGTGLEATFLGFHASNGRVVGIDSSEDMVKAADKRKNRYGLLNTEFIHGNCDEMPFGENEFDTAIFFSSLADRVQNTELAAYFRLCKANKILKPIGQVLIANAYSDEIESEDFSYIYKDALERAEFHLESEKNYSVTNEDGVNMHYSLITGKKK